MCISSNSVNQAQDLMSVTKFVDFPNSLIPNAGAGQILNIGIVSLQLITSSQCSHAQTDIN